MDEPSFMLSDEELRRLTGYVLKGKQRAWLKENRIKFTLDRFGHPRVARSHALARMGGAGPESRSASDATPNWDALGA